MSAKQRKRARNRDAPRRPVVGGPDREASYYAVRFIVKTPAELDLPEYVAKESPPTTDLGEARAAFNQLVAMMGSGEAQAAGLRSPQLVKRTVSEVVLEDYDRGQGIVDSEAAAIDERIDEAADEPRVTRNIDGIPVGDDLPLACGYCGHGISPGAHSCSNCGKAPRPPELDEPAAPAPASFRDRLDQLAAKVRDAEAAREQANDTPTP